MVHTGIYATAKECVDKAGANYNAVSVSTDEINGFCAQVESEVNVYGTRVFAADLTAFNALPATVRGVLSTIVSNRVAIYMIQYDMSGFTSRTEAEDMMIVLNVGAKKAISTIKDKEAQDMVMGLR